MLDDRMTARLAEALRAADFTANRAYELMGDQAHRALARNQVVPALRSTRGGSPTEVLIRLFSLQVPVDRVAADRALPGLVEAMTAAEMLTVSGGEVSARVDIRPYGDDDHDWWVVCDATPGLGGQVDTMDPLHVLGISEASSSLAQLVVRDRVGAALDLGTGCGVQALHLAQHVEHVVATDVNPRALAMADLTGRLNGVSFDVRDGSLFEPVAGERFDLIATNPPFVISPPGSPVLIYRDSGMPGDAVVRHIVENSVDHLNPGGWCQILANWAIRGDRSWQDELAGWVDGRDLDAWVVQREMADPAEYVEMWLADAGVPPGLERLHRYDAWLDWFEAEGNTGVGFGWLSLGRLDTAGAHSMTRFEEWTGPLAPPIGRAVAAWGRAVDLLRDVPDDDLRDLVLTARPMAQETIGRVGVEDPERIVLHLSQGVRRARQVDTVEAALVGACDGDLAVGQILDALGELLGTSDLSASALPAVRSLIEEGFLTP
ncbi:MAG TPA: class I SAM-dependent methyltransferase [Aeromicrobium sp.]|nr:class I SAM-dependent methyltransferase [Aeromicrobium sp.]